MRNIIVTISYSLRGYSSRNIPNLRKCVYFLNFTRIYMYILLIITVQKIKSKIEHQRCYFRDLNLCFTTSLTAVLFLKRRLLKITCFVNWQKQ